MGADGSTCLQKVSGERERKHKAHIFKDKEECVGAISSATEAVAVPDLSVVSVSSAAFLLREQLGRTFCSLINFQGRLDMRSECGFLMFSSYFVTTC